MARIKPKSYAWKMLVNEQAYCNRNGLEASNIIKSLMVEQIQRTKK